MTRLRENRRGPCNCDKEIIVRDIKSLRSTVLYYILL